MEQDDAQLIGGFAKTQWITSPKLVASGQIPKKYRLYTISGALGMGHASDWHEVGEAGDEFYTSTLKVAKRSKQELLGISTFRNAMPRLPKIVSTQSNSLLKEVRLRLIKKGFKKPKVKIVQAFEIDLNDSGNKDIIINASLEDPSTSSDLTQIKHPYYSFVMIYRKTKHTTQTLVLEGSFLNSKNPSEIDAVLYHISGFLDVFGNNKMAVILSWRGYEEHGYSIFSLTSSRVVRLNSVFIRQKD